MDQSLHLVFAFGSYGDHVPSVSHGDEILLQNFRVGAVDIVLQSLLDAAVRFTDLASDLGKLSAGFIGDHILR